jgi:hypothetical protein
MNLDVAGLPRAPAAQSPGKWPPPDASRGDARAREGALMTTRTGHQPPRRTSACPQPDCRHVAFRVTITPITPATRACTEYTATTLTSAPAGAHQVHARHEHAHGDGCSHLAVPHVITPTTTDGHRHASHEGRWDDPGRPGRYRPTSPPESRSPWPLAGLSPRPKPTIGQSRAVGVAWTTSRPVQHSAVGRLPMVRGAPTASASPPLPTDRPACSWPPAGAQKWPIGALLAIPAPDNPQAHTRRSGTTPCS